MVFIGYINFGAYYSGCAVISLKQEGRVCAFLNPDFRDSDISMFLGGLCLKPR